MKDLSNNGAAAFNALIIGCAISSVVWAAAFVVYTEIQNNADVTKVAVEAGYSQTTVPGYSYPVWIAPRE